MSNKNVVALFQEIYKDRKKFSQQVFEVASSDLVNMGITVVSYTLKDIRDEEVNQFHIQRNHSYLFQTVVSNHCRCRPRGVRVKTLKKCIKKGKLSFLLFNDG